MADLVRLQTPNRLGGELASVSDVVTAPGPFVEDGTFLELLAFSTVATGTLTLAGVFLPLSGGLTRFSQDMVLAGGGAQTAQRINLTAGYIIGFSVFVSAGTVTDGTTQASVDVVTATAGSGRHVANLASGDVSSNRRLGLGAYTGVAGSSSAAAAPTIVTTLQANPAAGADLTITVTAGQVWEVQAFRIQFTTSAAVATRTLDWVFDDGVNVLYRTEAQITQTAGITNFYNSGDLGTLWTPPTNNMYLIPVPKLLLGGGYRLRTAITNIQAADQISQAVISYRQY